MFKTNEYKAFGSIRKTKVAGACGVILALAMMAMVTNGNVSADEVKPSSPATTEVAKPAESPKKEAKADSKVEAKKEETVKPVESPNLDSAVEKAKSVGIKVTEKEKVGYDTEAEAKADEKAQVDEIDKKIAEKELNIKEIETAKGQNNQINADNKSAMEKAGLKHTGDYPKDKKTVDGYNAQAKKENTANEAKFKKEKLEAERIKAKDKAIMEAKGLKFTGNYAQDQKTVDAWNKANAGKVIKSIQTGLTATANTTFEVISGGSKAVAPDYTANVIQGYARDTNLDASFDNVFLLDDKSGTIKIKVKNTSNGDVTLTFSNITPSAESGFIRSYVALWAGEDGGIGYGVFISAGAGEANGGGGVDGQGGGGASGAYRNDRQGWVKMVTVGVLTDSDNVSEVTVNDVDSNQVIDVSSLDGAKVTTGANISQSGNSFTANDSAQSQSTAGVLDSNGIGWSFEKGQKINFTFIHSNTSDTSYSIVGGVFGRASQKEVKEKPISIEKYNDPKYTPKPYVTIKPHVPVPEEKQVEVEYHKAYVKEVPVIPESPEPQKPQEPNKPSLPETGTASSMLGYVGTGILSMLGLVGMKRKKD
ncbi:putative cross-wall-targeting lipoprotein signal domain-containing proteiin [Streptococcus oralis]|jgi:putative cross-wall-targeting lipoprotein signal|uniref:putative cross-wall-targeting lipoprotein signal domain-containing proteiin n=1 Tax=Streptococcus oralis TaxID=1303 RepID=UPI0022839CD6|nr:putative cross-wall-targeting lipoprotein signal domain-containing proteiin [Streptococcus oralis]MCY7088737.1 LPXTG cell wall anchor domain-containing protein [Streptococcus oralis]